MFAKTGKPTTHIGHLIDVATDGATNSAENWAMYMEICDAVNATEDGPPEKGLVIKRRNAETVKQISKYINKLTECVPKDAAKAIRKKFSVKDEASITYTLSLLETCVKNCGKRFHLQIASKDFLQDMVKLISPKYSPSIQTQLTVLGLIQTWAYAFNKYPELKEVNKTYQELKTKGVEFPPLDPDKASATNIPPWSAPTVTPTNVGTAAGRHPSQAPSGGRPSIPGGGSRPPATAGEPVEMSAERVAKLHSELQTVQQNCKVFSDMLTEASNSSNTSDVELLEDLSTTCRQMQQRMQELLQTVQHEEITGELLTVNDELNNVFIRYERFQRMSSGREGLEPPTDSAQLYPPPPQPSGFNPYAPPPYPAAQTGGVTSTSNNGPAVANLIDLDEPPPSHATGASHPPNQFTQDFSNMGISGGDDFDAFAQSRKSTDHPPVNDKESDFLEMQKWLLENPSTGGATTGHSGAGADSVSNLEFERFLTQRQQEAERLPSVGQSQASGASGSASKPGAVNNEPLFSL